MVNNLDSDQPAENAKKLTTYLLRLHKYNTASTNSYDSDKPAQLRKLVRLFHHNNPNYDFMKNPNKVSTEKSGKSELLGRITLIFTITHLVKCYLLSVIKIN